MCPTDVFINKWRRKAGKLTGYKLKSISDEQRPGFEPKTSRLMYQHSYHWAIQSYIDGPPDNQIFIHQSIRSGLNLLQ